MIKSWRRRRITSTVRRAAAGCHPRPPKIQVMLDKLRIEEEEYRRAVRRACEPGHARVSASSPATVATSRRRHCPCSPASDWRIGRALPRSLTDNEDYPESLPLTPPAVRVVCSGKVPPGHSPLHLVLAFPLYDCSQRSTIWAELDTSHWVGLALWLL